jgi:hypothetical protein
VGALDTVSAGGLLELIAGDEFAKVHLDPAF